MNAPADRPLTIRPPPRSVIDSITAWVHSNGPRRFTLRTRSQSGDRHVGQAVGREVGHDRCVVDQDVDSAELAAIAADVIWAADSAEVTSRWTATARKPLSFKAVCGALRCVEVDVGDHHRGADFTKRLGVDRTDVAGAAGHHGDLPGEVEKFRLHPSEH